MIHGGDDAAAQRAQKDARRDMARELLRGEACPHPGPWVDTREDLGLLILTSARCELCGHTWVTVQGWPVEGGERETAYF